VAEIHHIEDPGFYRLGPAEYAYQQVMSEASGMKFASFVMSDSDKDDEAPCVSLLWIEPNGRLPKHSHDCHRVEVVVRGSIDVAGRTLSAGHVAISGPGEWYGPHIAGPDGCLSVEVFSTLKGQIAHLDDEPSPEDAKVVANAMKALEDWVAAGNPGPQ
jgi:hypothetical protein